MSQGGSLSAHAIDETRMKLVRLQRAMAKWGIVPPAEGWEAWSRTFVLAPTDAKTALLEEGQYTMRRCSELLILHCLF